LLATYLQHPSPLPVPALAKVGCGRRYGIERRLQFALGDVCTKVHAFEDRPAGLRPRGEYQPVDAAELQEPLLIAVLATVLCHAEGRSGGRRLRSGEGFTKLPYDRELPTRLLLALMQIRIKDY